MSSTVKDLRRVRMLLALALALTTGAVTGCAAHYTADTVHDPYGFLAGIWHGLVAPWAILANLVSWALGLIGISFMESIQIVGRPNTGWTWYYVGFALGVGSYSGGTRQKTRQP